MPMFAKRMNTAYIHLFALKLLVTTLQHHAIVLCNNLCLIWTLRPPRPCCEAVKQGPTIVVCASGGY
jgi:hypothetical protein